jgi:protein-S-isoprenylcysteine O-methyltransferase Ste14
VKLTKGWDMAFGIVYTLSVVLTPAIAGLDVGRYHWSGLDVRFAALGILLFMPGAALVTWAMAVNKFFEGTVRIQKDRGQKVITTGPYKFVRHPGYAGMVLIYVAPPLILGSAYALIPAAAIVVGLVVRTHFEDKMLFEELEGYKEYTKKVKYRLVPGIW